MRDLERLTQWGQHHLHSVVETTMPGVALFTCAAANLWVEFPSPLPFEDEFTIADRPMVRQLARLDEDYTNALLVLVDSRTARIYEVVLGGFLAETDFASIVQLLVHRAGHGGLAVLGLQATLEAVNTARVHKLAMHHDFHRLGWRCRTCGALAAETHLQYV
jgi:hypothetical protein